MRWISLVALLMSGAPALAHPHIFIDSGLELVFDSRGQLAAVRVTWAYDEFYSLMQLEELGLDPDGDGELTEAELEELAGFDTNWVEGYEGDLYVTAGGEKVALAGPIRAGARMEEGRIVTWHTRPLVTRIDPAAAEVVLKVYDPTYYTAYTLELGVALTGRQGCSVTRIPADLGRAYDAVEELLYGPGSDGASEDNFPPVGELFADTLTLTCAPPS